MISFHPLLRLLNRSFLNFTDHSREISQTIPTINMVKEIQKASQKKSSENQQLQQWLFTNPPSTCDSFTQGKWPSIAQMCSSLTFAPSEMSKFQRHPLRKDPVQRCLISGASCRRANPKVIAILTPRSADSNRFLLAEKSTSSSEYQDLQL